jgi:Gram-negative bacterial tonB protein.
LKRMERFLLLRFVEGIGYGCDENARLSVYYTRFKPGLQKGQRVKVQMIIPIEFKLDKTLN